MAPRSGSRIQLAIAGYHGAIGSDYDYTQVTLDARLSVPLPRQHVLAARVYGLQGFGDVPSQMQSQLGGDSRLRAFFAGRCRDDHLLRAMGEYRLPLYWRISGAVFAGAGDVAGTDEGHLNVYVAIGEAF